VFVQLRLQTQEQKRQQLPPEPAADYTDAPISSIMFRMPDGSRQERRFLASDKVATLYDYLEVNARDAQWADYKLATSFPKRDLLDHSQTLQEADLVPDALLMVIPK
jgi:hypothetical protein